MSKAVLNYIIYIHYRARKYNETTGSMFPLQIHLSNHFDLGYLSSLRCY